ncbi:Peroxisomal Biogenesis Factor 3 [Manis pentadactyla]|nr:Peroxisomal Biogenesis Factor 3 [Manis pentadactyla]
MLEEKLEVASSGLSISLHVVAAPAVTGTVQDLLAMQQVCGYNQEAFAKLGPKEEVKKLQRSRSYGVKGI